MRFTIQDITEAWKEEQMRTKIFLTILMVLCLATLGMAAEKSFKTTLSGDEIAPPANTMAKGEATFQLSRDGMELKYKVTVSDIENVTASHIHQGAKGKSGPPLALIDIKGKKVGKFSGALAEGTITGKELMGPMKGKSVKDLVKEIEAGNTYVNVHTDKFPDGELRGQLK